MEHHQVSDDKCRTSRLSVIAKDKHTSARLDCIVHEIESFRKVALYVLINFVEYLNTVIVEVVRKFRVNGERNAKDVSDVKHLESFPVFGCLQVAEVDFGNYHRQIILQLQLVVRCTHLYHYNFI